MLNFTKHMFFKLKYIIEKGNFITKILKAY
jgi:hypothetical protein